MKKLVVARSWREFKTQQAAAVYSLYEVFKDYDVHLHLVINDHKNEALIEALRKKMPNWKINIYDNLFFDEYALLRGATPDQIAEFPKWMWIYHLLLYHFLWHSHREDYVLTYDDDIFFRERPEEVCHKVNNKIPFCMADQHSDSDKPLMGKLVLHFGNWIHDEYYACWGSTWSSNSGFMGLANRAIFENFSSPEDFRKMLDMFEYRVYRHEDDNTDWKDYRILLQEQSFLGILNRAFSNRKHAVLIPEYGYSINDHSISKVHHYVAKAKLAPEFQQRIKSKYEELLKFLQ
jgi:hypothetical protein